MTQKAVPPNGIVGNKILKSNPSTSSLYGLDVVSDEHKQLVEDISKHIIYGMLTFPYNVVHFHLFLMLKIFSKSSLCAKN